MINIDANDLQDLDEAGPEDKEDKNIVVDQEDNAEVDDDAIGEREDQAEATAGPSKKRKTTSELAREAYTSYLGGIERARALENKMMKCMDKFLDM